MSPPNVSLSEAKLRLIEAAEILFADKGFETVSIRDITTAAKANVAAINYHFGSRDGLVNAILSRYIVPVNDERLLRLDQAERSHGSKPLPIEQIVDAFARPLVTQVRKSELSERLFFKLLGRSFAQQNQGLPPELEAQFSVLINRFVKALAKTLPGLTQEELVWRFHFAAGAMIHMLTHGEALVRLTGGASGAPTMDATISRFIRFAAAGFRDGLDLPPIEADHSQGLLFDF
jgi:AcrR family transcriptional regulator